MPASSSTTSPPPGCPGTDVRARSSPNGWSLASCSICSTSTGAVCVAATCSICSPTSRLAAKTARSCGSPDGNGSGARPGSIVPSTGSLGSPGSRRPLGPGPNRNPDARAAAERHAEAADELAEFVAALQRDLGHPMATRSWSDWADWCERQIAWRLGTRLLVAARRGRTVGPRPHRPGCSTGCVTSTRSAPRSGAVSSGRCSPPSSRSPPVGSDGSERRHDRFAQRSGRARLRSRDRARRRRRSAPTCPQHRSAGHRADRRAAGLPTSGARAIRVHRNFLAVLDSADEVVIGVPRGDLRSTTERQPSRWLAAHVADADWQIVGSHHAGLIATEFPAADHEHRLRHRSQSRPSTPV